MYGNYTDGVEIYRIHQIRYADRLRAARAARQARQARPPAEPRPLLAPALAWLGERFIGWGCALEQAAGHRCAVYQDTP